MKVVQRPSSEATVSVPWCFLAGRLGREEGLKDPGGLSGASEP